MRNTPCRGSISLLCSTGKAHSTASNSILDNPKISLATTASRYARASARPAGVLSAVLGHSLRRRLNEAKRGHAVPEWRHLRRRADESENHGTYALYKRIGKGAPRKWKAVEEK